MRENVRRDACKSLLDLSTVGGNELNDTADALQLYQCTAPAGSSLCLRSSKEHNELHSGSKLHPGRVFDCFFIHFFPFVYPIYSVSLIIRSSVYANNVNPK